MKVSEQIIEVFDHLAQKFGVVIDWGQQNVIPYIQKLCNKYITWEIATSIVWICIGIVCVIVGCVFLKAALKWHNTYKDGPCYEGYGTSAFAAAAIFFGIVGFIVVAAQKFDIIKCCTFPELQITRQIMYLTNRIR